MYLVRAPCKKTDRSVGMSLDKYEYIIILQKKFQIGHPICISAGQPVIGRLASRFANEPDWQIGRSICI